MRTFNSKLMRFEALWDTSHLCVTTNIKKKIRNPKTLCVRKHGSGIELVTLYIRKCNFFYERPIPLTRVRLQPHDVFKVHGEISGDGTSDSVENVVQLNRGFVKRHLKEEESEDEAWPRTLGEVTPPFVTLPF